MRSPWWLLGTLVLLTSCRPERGLRNLNLENQVQLTVAGFDVALYQSVGTHLVDGNRAELLENGSVFDAIVEEIRSAKESVHILVYIWREGTPSKRIIEALEARKADSLGCRIMVDGVGSTDFEKTVRPKLANAGCDVRHFGKFGETSKRRAMARNHRKLVIVDGRVGITGGFGIQDPWMGDGVQENQWRDTHVRIRGPVVNQMQAAFGENWQELGGALLPPSTFPAAGASGDAPAAYISSSGSDTITAARRMVHLLVEAPQKRLWIANSYFVPSDDLIRQLVRKKSEGVDVRVLVPGDIHDIRPVLESQRATYEALLKGGVRIFEYQPSMMHAKTWILDAEAAVIGSTNLDALSLEKLDEGSLVTFDAKLNQQMAANFERDLSRSKEITEVPSPPRMSLRRALRKVLWFSSVGLFEQ